MTLCGTGIPACLLSTGLEACAHERTLVIGDRNINSDSAGQAKMPVTTLSASITCVATNPWVNLLYADLPGQQGK